MSIPDPITSIGLDLKFALALNVSAFGKSVANTLRTTVKMLYVFDLTSLFDDVVLILDNDLLITDQQHHHVQL